MKSTKRSTCTLKCLASHTEFEDVADARRLADTRIPRKWPSVQESWSVRLARCHGGVSPPPNGRGQDARATIFKTDRVRP